MCIYIKTHENDSMRASLVLWMQTLDFKTAMNQMISSLLAEGGGLSDKLRLWKIMDDEELKNSHSVALAASSTRLWLLL